MTTDTPVTAPRNAGTTGRISLVGIGPGHTDHMTARARAAIAEADVVVGYVTYIKLVADLLDGKEVVRKGMTEGKTLEQLRADGLPEKWSSFGNGFITNARWIETIYNQAHKAVPPAGA